MKKLIALLVSILTFALIGGVASAQPKLCSMSASYRAIYEYPTGSYWTDQLSRYPAYYTAHNTFYQTKYGC